MAGLSRLASNESLDMPDRTFLEKYHLYRKKSVFVHSAFDDILKPHGFDENNSRLLNLSDSLHIGKTQGKTILFTNFNDHNLVNKKASRVITGSPRAMLAGTPEINQTELGSSCEKSRRTVYDALALDFDSPEED
jgi:hypothetical protein